MQRVIGVVGGSGGVGTSTLAAAVAGGSADGVLVDLDPAAGGVDVLLGVDAEVGARWSDLHLAGGGLDPDVLLDGLPRWRGCPVLAADTAEIGAEAVRQVLAALAEVPRTVVLDLPRADSPARAAALPECDLVVVLARGDVVGLVGAHTVVAALPQLPVGVVVRRDRIPPEQAAELVGAALLGTLAPIGASVDLGAHRVPRPMTRVARGVLAGLGAVPPGSRPAA